MAKSMRQNKCALCSSRRPLCRKRNLRSARAVNGLALAGLLIGATCCRDGIHLLPLNTYENQLRPASGRVSITFRETTVTTKHLAEGIAADYDAEGRLAGLEILDAQKRFGGPDTIRRVELEGVGT